MPPSHPWCKSPESVCPCFGTPGPSTALRDPQGPIQVRCEAFIADGGTTRSYTDIKKGGPS